MKKIYNNLLEAIGNTPIVRLNKVVGETQHEFYAKLEYLNPGGSVKDRVALAIIEEAERRGTLKKGCTIIEATSGNTGVGLAMVAAIKGYKTIFVMPEKVSQEKQDLLKAYGAELVITPSNVEPEDPRHYINVAHRLVESVTDSFCANQYHNPDNPAKHYRNTAPEIWDQMEGHIDVFSAGAGTGGTISGVGKFLKEKNKNIKVIMPDPVGSILYDLYYHKKIVDKPAAYKVEGVGEDMLPENVHFQYVDAVVKVDDKSAFNMARKLIAKEGLCVGPSSALALVGAMEYSKTLEKPAKILVLFADSGRAYLSKAFNEKWMKENNFL